jgi:hypothetical protein
MTHAASWRMLSAVLFAVSLTAVPTRSHATIGEYSTRSSFEAAVLRSATDTFEDLNSQFVETPLIRSMGPYSYSISADLDGQPGFIYGLPSAPTSAPATWLTTDAVDSEITFSGFAPDINGIGASFFITTFAGDISSAASLRVTATYASDSVTQLIAGTSDTSFLGFVLDEQLLTLTVAAVQPASGGPYWLTVAGLTVASLSPVPEVPSAALLLMGLFATFMRHRRRAPTAS